MNPFPSLAGIALSFCLVAVSAWAQPGASENVTGKETKATGRTMKLMTYNILHGAGMDGRWNLWRTADVIRRAAPDVACLQEVEVKSSRSFCADEPKMLAYLLNPKIRFSRFSKSIDFGGGEYGNAMISAEEPISTKVVPLPGGEPRSFLLCEFKDYYVGTAHLALLENECLESVPIIVEAIREAKKPIFITGDWNVQPDSPVIEAIKKHFVILSDPAVCTWSAREPQVCIDYIAVDKAHADKVKVHSVEVLDEREASDHRPIVLSFELLP